MIKINPVFAAACFALFLFGITLITLGSVLPDITKVFSLDGVGTGSLVAVLPAGILAGSLVFGPIADRYGYQFLLIASIFFSASGLIGLALTHSLIVLYVCVFMIGFGGGIINGGTSALVADISTGNKGASLSILGIFFGLGALGMPLILGLLNDFSTPAAILTVTGGLMFLPMICFFFIPFPPPKHADGLPVKKSLTLISSPTLLLTGFFLFFQSGTEGLVNNWTTTFLQQKLMVSNQQSLFALSCSIAGLTAMRLATRFILKKINSFQLLTISILLIIAGSLVLFFTPQFPIAFAGLIIIGIGLSAGFPLMLGLIGQLYAELSGTAFSIAFVIALTGNIAVNYVTGIMVQHTGINNLPLLIACCATSMMILLAGIKSKLRH